MNSALPYNLCDVLLAKSSQSNGEHHTAIIYRGQPVSSSELRQRVFACAAQLAAFGIGPGDRVGLVLYDSPDFVAWFLGAAAIGAVSVPVNTALSAGDIAGIVADSGTSVVVCETALRENVVPHEGNPQKPSVRVVCREEVLIPQSAGALAFRFAPTLADSPAFMLYTSGTTGTPKGALHCHAAPLQTAATYSDSILQLTGADRIYSASRMFFAYGLGNSLTFPLAAGATVILDDAKPTPERIAALFAEAKPTVFFGVPAIYRALLDCAARQNLDTSGLRLCLSAGEALPAPLFEEWRDAFGIEILDGIGSTEMLHIFISNRPGEAMGGSSGKPVPGYTAELRDETGQGISPDIGNLWVSGPSAFLGYWKRPELSDATRVEGWIKTGDVYRRDTAGLYYHSGRSDDCFKVHGLWVSAIDVETVLVSHPAVKEAAVVAATDSDGLATGRAYIVIRPAEQIETTVRELKEFASARLPRYKVPSEFVVVKSLPRTSTGKIQRFKLRQLGAD